MIRLILTGGLGNQMFEYAAAKSLALRLNKRLEIDLYALNKKTKGTKRSLELGVFSMDLNISSSLKTKFLVKAFPIVERNRAFFKKYFGYFRDGSAIVYCPNFDNLKGNTILHGHFQNIKYFEEYEGIIRKDFTFREPLKDKNLEIAKNMVNSNSISIHIRRGDYLTDSHAKNNFAVCSLEYYQKAIQYMREQTSNPQFFIFSEDINWAKENLIFEDSCVEFIDWNKEEEDSFIDMQLMSICKHNIIANSSFSWWAAWLNANSNKKVIAPNQWFNSKIRNKDLSDFYPENWIVI